MFFIDSFPEINYALGTVILILVLVGNHIVHTPNSTIKSTVITSIVLYSLIVGFILVSAFFPNLSVLMKRLSYVLFFSLFYILSLVNNVFLVVSSREESIPLYRVAVTWSKILISLISIPLLAGLFKISVNAFGETLLILLLSILFYIYLIWFLEHDADVKNYKAGELITLIILGSFLVVLANIAVSFFPTETFLRALFVSSILIFGISYIEAHLKNSITKKLITESLTLSVIFLVLLFIFHP